MIRIDATLIPHGIGEGKSLGTLEIANDGTGDLCTGNYRIRLKDKRGRVRRRGKIEGFKRLEKGVWELALRALEEIFKRRGWDIGEENDEAIEGS
jgi:hypothetical protein